MVDLPRLKIAVEDYGHTRAVKAYSSKVWIVDDEEHVMALKLPPNVVHRSLG